MATLGECLTAIGDAIRTKTGTTDTMTIAEMPTLIDSLVAITDSVLNISVIEDGQFSGLEVGSLILPDVTSVGNLAFENSAIETLIIGENLQSVIGVDGTIINDPNGSFNDMTSLTKVIFRGWCPPLYTDPPFKNSPIAEGNGYIYVPDELYEQYMRDGYWASYSSMIKPISEL